MVKMLQGVKCRLTIDQAQVSHSITMAYDLWNSVTEKQALQYNCLPY